MIKETIFWENMYNYFIKNYQKKKKITLFYLKLYEN